MEKECRYSYSDIDDNLIVSCKEENENVRENFMIDNMIFSLTGKGKIVGLQIQNFSEMLKETNIESNILNQLKSINLIILQRENCLFIALKLVLINGEAKVPLGRIFMPQIVRQT